MKTRFVVFLLVLSMSLVSIGVAAASGGTELKALTDGAAMLYAEPNAESEVVAELGAYSTLTLVATDETGAWLEVEAAEGSGFVMLEDVIVLNLPLLAPQVYVSTGQAGATGLYAEPAFSAEFVASLNDGAVATVLGAKGEWAYVMTEAGMGWSVASAWAVVPEDAYQAVVSLGANPEMGVFAEAMVGADVAATVPDGAVIWVMSMVDDQWAEVMLADGSMGFAIASNLAPLSDWKVDAMAGGNANPAVYAEPDFSADIIATLPDGEMLTYVGMVDDFWVEVYHPMVGFAYGLADSFGPVYTTATVEQQNALVRSGPNDNLYGVIAQLDADTEVIVKGVSESGAWVDVVVPFGELDFAYNGVDGWMRDFLFVDDLGNASVDISMLEVTE